jgi:hypothetical protein
MKYLFIAFIFFACRDISHFNNPPEVSTEPLDTINASTARIDATPVFFESAFIKGTSEKRNGTTVKFYGVTIGKLKIKSGHIIACDPMHIDEYGKPFTQVFPTGEFPVQLSIAKFDYEEKIAFARINFSDEPVARWEFAFLEGQTPIAVGGDKMHGYSVDAGVGVFIDAAANKALDRNNVTRMGEGIYQEMDQHYHNTWRYAMYNFGNHNLAAFSSGDGDGYYATYIGFDAGGKPCRLLTDFNLFDWSHNKK